MYQIAPKIFLAKIIEPSRGIVVSAYKVDMVYMIEEPTHQHYLVTNRWGTGR